MTTETKVTHTPGPWRDQPLSRRDPTPGVNIWITGPDGQVVATLPDTAAGNANARLIAAAPDLLAALKLYVEHFGDPLKVARPAIAKAEGR